MKDQYIQKFLENLTWYEAKEVMNNDSVIVIPLGASAKEHGPHLKLNNDFLMAEYFKKEVAKKLNVLIAPTVNYHFYPAFVDYPGSTHLRLETARDLIVDICYSFSRHGPKKFYVINTGISTLAPLKLAAEILDTDGIILKFTNLDNLETPELKKIIQQEGGSHADEVETSLMLFIAPEHVDMSLAKKDYHEGKGKFTLNPENKNAIYSPTGIWGNATLATREKGEIVAKTYSKGIISDIELLIQE